MKYVCILFLFSLLYFPSQSQEKKCNCPIDSSINESTVSCEVKVLSNGAKLYWQYTCDRIWLTLQQKDGKKKVINEVPIEYYGYTFRLGFHLMKEYKTSLLFRSGCPANGPCNFILIDKNTGKKIEEFGELIYDHKTQKLFDFVVSFQQTNTLRLYYVNAKKSFLIKVHPDHFRAVVPEYSIDEISLKNRILKLYTDYGVITIDLKKYGG